MLFVHIVSVATLLLGQAIQPVATAPADPMAARLRVMASPLSPQQMIRAMARLDQAQRKVPGATVEIIGYDDEAALRVMALNLAEQARLAFRPMDSRGHQELYAFMHQDPRKPGPVMLVPVMAGGPVVRAEDSWLK